MLLSNRLDSDRFAAEGGGDFALEQIQQLIGPEILGQLDGILHIPLAKDISASHQGEQGLEQLGQHVHFPLATPHVKLRFPRIDHGGDFSLNQL
ncbi:hypothetical protein D3C71_1408600 [compost metagenome]